MKTGTNLTANPAEALATVRARIASLKTRIATAEDAPVPRAVAIARVDQYLASLTESQQWDIGRAFTTTDLDTATINGAMQQPPMQLLAWLAPEVLRDGLIRNVAAAYSSLGAEVLLDPSKRTSTLAELTAALFVAEVAEERLIVSAEANGYTLARRAGASPAAILAA